MLTSPASEDLLTTSYLRKCRQLMRVGSGTDQHIMVAAVLVQHHRLDGMQIHSVLIPDAARSITRQSSSSQHGHDTRGYRFGAHGKCCPSERSLVASWLLRCDPRLPNDPRLLGWSSEGGSAIRGPAEGASLHMRRIMQVLRTCRDHDERGGEPDITSPVATQETVMQQNPVRAVGPCCSARSAFYAE